MVRTSALNVISPAIIDLDFALGNVALARYPVAVLIGLLSDTHDRLEAATAAVTLLQARGAEFLIHCGDVGSEQVLDLLAGIPVAFVWGNNDIDRRPMEAYAALLGLRCLGEFGELELGGRSFAIVHGDDARALRRVLTEQKHDYLLHGHTHVRRDERVGRVRIINPGALHRAKEKTVALLDTETDRLTFLALPSA